MYLSSKNNLLLSISRVFLSPCLRKGDNMSKRIQRNKKVFSFTPYFIIAVMVLFASCEKDDKYDYHVVDGDDPVEEIDILVVSGNYQECAIGDTTADSLIVFVSKDLVPEPAWPVDYSIISGEGTLVPKRTVTNLQGHAGVRLVPTGLPGTIKVQALPFNGSATAVFTITSTD
jgi:hypothetical protein